MSKDYYKILGVSKNASQSEIKNAYMKLVKKYHPDINPNNKEFEEKFKEINEAYETLKDVNKRKQYDNFGSEYSQGNYQNYRQSTGSGGFDQGFSGFDFEDIFKQFGFGFDDMFGSRSSRQKKTRAADLQYSLEISLEDAFYGANKTIEIPTQEVCPNCGGVGYTGNPKTCPQCHGTGQVRRVVQSPFGSMVTVNVCDKCEGKGKIYDKKCDVCRGTGVVKGKKSLNVKIPKGVSTGTVLRLKNEGFSDAKAKGDLYLKIIVRKHPLFSVEHSDLFSKIHVNLVTTLLGGEVEVKTIDGHAKLKIPKGIQSHTIMKMKGLGMPELKSNRRGDYYLKVIIDIPKDLTKYQTEALKIIFGKNKKESKDFLKKLKSFFS